MNDSLDWGSSINIIDKRNNEIITSDGENIMSSTNVNWIIYDLEHRLFFNNV